MNINDKTEVCPKCLGANTLMMPKEIRGFEYKSCNLCKGTGEVSSELAEDFELSINEDNIEFDNNYE